jgi:hypothetical protein
VQHLMHISLQHGFNFLVHPTAFVVHVPHKKPSTKWLTRKMGQVGGTRPSAASAALLLLCTGGEWGAAIGLQRGPMKRTPEPACTARPVLPCSRAAAEGGEPRDLSLTLRCTARLALPLYCRRRRRTT